MRQPRKIPDHLKHWILIPVFVPRKHELSLNFKWKKSPAVSHCELMRAPQRAAHGNKGELLNFLRGHRIPASYRKAILCSCYLKRTESDTASPPLPFISNSWPSFLKRVRQTRAQPCSRYRGRVYGRSIFGSRGYSSGQLLGLKVFTTLFPRRHTASSSVCV